MEDKVLFKNSKGDKLCGILTNPSGDITNLIIVFIHGFNSNKDSRTLALTRYLLNKKNISTFRFDLFGQGESEGKFEELTLTEGINDGLAAIAVLKKRGYKKIGVIGGSFGANVAIHIASRLKSVLLLGLISSAVDYKEQIQNALSKSELQEWKEQGYRTIKDGKRINYTYYQDIVNHSAFEAARDIRIPTLIIHGDDDESVPVSQSIKLSKIIPHNKLVLIKGADHHYSNPLRYEEMSKVMADFILKFR